MRCCRIGKALPPINLEAAGDKPRRALQVRRRLAKAMFVVLGGGGVHGGPDLSH